MRRALGTMPWKVPIVCLARLIMLVVAYLAVMCGIRILHLKTLEQTRISLNCAPKQTQEEYSAMRKA
jgi:hypothetical protein